MGKTSRRPRTRRSEVIIVGGGLAGLSAAIYLGRAKRAPLVLDERKSMARWEPNVQNYLGFPGGIAGAELVRSGRKQAFRYGVRFSSDRVKSVQAQKGWFRLHGRRGIYSCKRLLVATGIFHVPPDLPELNSCLGRSLFFCKDCDGFRVQGQSVAVYGWTDEAVDYALALLFYSPCVTVLTDGRSPLWDKLHQGWLQEYCIPVYQGAILSLEHRSGRIRSVTLAGGTYLFVASIFITRGDIYYNDLARQLGAKLDRKGQIIVYADMRTTVPGVYAAGCVTPANCQMIIAAGQGATAAQAINRDLFNNSLADHSLRRFRRKQLRTGQTRPRRSAN